MKNAVTILAMLLAVHTFAAEKPKASGPVKAFKGPEGEKVILLEAEDGKKMYVHPKNVGGDWDGTTRLFDVHSLGDGKKDVYFMKKRGSKQEQWNVLVQRNSQWEFYNPTKDQHFSLRYAEDESGKISVDDVLNAYKP